MLADIVFSTGTVREDVESHQLRARTRWNKTGNDFLPSVFTDRKRDKYFNPSSEEGAGRGLIGTLAECQSVFPNKCHISHGVWRLLWYFSVVAPPSLIIIIIIRWWGRNLFSCRFVISASVLLDIYSKQKREVAIISARVDNIFIEIIFLEKLMRFGAALAKVAF